MNRFQHALEFLKTRAAAAAVGWVVIAILGTAGCDSRPLPSPEPQSFIPEPLPSPRYITRLDVLFAVDNSPSMIDKRQILADAVPDLIARLANPLCVDENDVATVAAKLAANAR